MASARQLAILAKEIAEDPLSRGYSSMSANDAAEDINALSRPIPISSREVRKYLQLSGLWAAISDDSRNSADVTDRRACLGFIDALTDFEDFDLTDPSVYAAVSASLDALVILQYIDASPHKAVILALGDNQISRGEELGAGVIAAGDILWVNEHG